MSQPSHATPALTTPQSRTLSITLNRPGAADAFDTQGRQKRKQAFKGEYPC